LATALRFIPYLGPWIAAAFPILLSLATAPGSMALLLTIGLFVALELISNMRGSSPALKIVVGLWGRPKLEPETVQSLRGAGADAIVTTLAEAIEWVTNAASTAGARPAASPPPRVSVDVESG
jgi:hypothetical protein